MTDNKPEFTVALRSGIWLVCVHEAHPPRIWRFNGEGFEGNGDKVKRAEVARTVNELIIRAEKREGIWPA